MAEKSKTEGAGKVPKKAAPPRRERSHDFVSRYTNGATIVNTQFDLQLIFGQLVFQPDMTFVVQEHTLVAMAPAHAKSLYELLGQRLKDWEKSYGPIQLKRAAGTNSAPAKKDAEQ